MGLGIIIIKPELIIAGRSRSNKMEDFIMGRKYCPNCNEVVETRALPYYKQIEIGRIPVKKRKIKHRVEEGGCGHAWFTIELPIDLLDELI